jgi:pyruvate,water dikinase
MMKIVTTAVELLEPEAGRETGALEGLGIGSESYTGTACVVDNAVDAIDRLQPGDVLVTPFTAPSFNAILPMAGALVVQEGGLLCHAAVMARELELSAIIGCVDALTSIRDGDQVEVDPVAGRVRLV